MVWWASAPTTRADAFRRERVMKLIFASRAIAPHKEWVIAKFERVLGLAIRVRESREADPCALADLEMYGSLEGTLA